MRFRSLSCCFLLMVVGHSLYAQPKPVVAQWHKFRTKHFTVVANTDPVRSRNLATRLEQFRSAVQTILGVARNDQIETRVVVFRDAASFRPFKPKRSDGTADDLVSGQFHAGSDVNSISAADDGKGNSTVFHEYVHDVLAQNYAKSDVPAWLNEGLAEYFQGFRLAEGSRIEFGLPDRSHLAILRRQTLIPWKDFFSIDDVSLQQSSDNARLAFYAQAWALTSYLIHNSAAGGFSPGRFVQKARALSTEELTAGVHGMLVAADTRPPSIKAPVDAIRTDLQASQLTEAETNAYLGDLAVRVRNLAAAESYLTIAVSQAPDLAVANLTLGFLRLNQRRFAEARKLFEKAIATESDNFLVYFYSAYLISREQTDEFGTISRVPDGQAVKMREHLRRAIALNPRHAESYKLLAVASLVNGDQMDDALATIRKAIDLQPVNSEYRLIASQILLRQESLAEAKAAAAEVLSSTSDKFLRGEAEEVIRSADAFLKARLEPGTVYLRLDGALEPKPLILNYEDLTDEEVARIELNREISNLNRLIDRPRFGERQEVGRIEHVRCVSGNTVYSFRGENGLLRLAGGSFEDLRARVLLSGTHSFTFRCGVSFAKTLAVVIYRPDPRAGQTDGRFVSVAFVPDNFRLKSVAELSSERQVIIEGRRQSDLAANAKAVEAEQKELYRQLRETQLRNIEARLREPLSGERRLIAIPEKLDCVDGRMILHTVSGSSRLAFFARLAAPPEVRSFTPETGILEFGCRIQPPPISAVITYRNDPTMPGRNELISVEFVPAIFKLNSTSVSLP